MIRIVLVYIFLHTLSFQLYAQTEVTTHLKNQKVTSIHLDEKRQLYFSTTDTTYLFDGVNFIHSSTQMEQDTSLISTVEKHLKIQDEFDLAGSITTSAELSNARVIFTNSTSRLYQKYEDKILRYLVPDLEEENLIINKLIGVEDYLLICTLNDGLYIWKPEEFSLDKLNYSRGLTNNNINDALLDDWGNLWIATDFGLQQIAYIDKSKTSIPDVTIDKINLHYDKVSRDDIVTLRESQNDLQFIFSSRDYSQNKTIATQYRLGEQYEWKDVDGNQVSVSNILPGKYSFELRASNGNGLYAYTEAINFSIKASSFTTAWKYVFGILGALSFLWLWSFFRYNSSLKNFKSERNKLKLENDLLKTEQKALQLQMNPHFVFNALNSIQGLIATNENKAARKYLNKFSTMMRSMLDQSRGEAIDIDAEIKYLDDYLSLEQMGKEGKFDFSITKSDDIPQIRIPVMLIQPFVENAIVHGMKGLDKKGMINIDFKIEKDQLVCEIDDNGVGRKPNNLKSNHKSVALSVVKERLQKYSKFKNYENLQILDKKNPDGTSAGTHIKINLPQL